MKLGRFSVGSPLTDGTLSQTIKRPVLHRVLRNRAREDGVTFAFEKRLKGWTHRKKRVFAERDWPALLRFAKAYHRGGPST